MKRYCYVVIQNTYPVEVFLKREDAIAFIKNWVGSYPNGRVFCYRCPLSDTFLKLQLI